MSLTALVNVKAKFSGTGPYTNKLMVVSRLFETGIGKAADDGKVITGILVLLIRHDN